MCPKCGNYSVGNDAIAALETLVVPYPNPQTFLEWMKNEVVRPELANQGPLVSMGNVRYWKQDPKDET